ncbi:MarR family winged helix-turn-helix transcriptional regulator [Nonomuraea sp. NPDC059194]|uniref:MarR family winged helix-turn-helix transcriptional regulator n=1 Tax=Nonomuraea sp. NPDC059194 TaxID=3346764 RepID=UPI0036A12A5C
MTRRSSDAVDQIMEQWRRELPEVDIAPLAVFGRLHRSFLRYQVLLNEVFETYGISMAAFDVLTALRRSGSPYRMTAGQLAETSLVSTGGVTLRVDRLEKAGLVVRERDPDDRRVVYAQLTDAGLDLVERVAQTHFANEQRMLAKLTDVEQRQLARLLSRLESSLEAAGRAAQAQGNGSSLSPR